MRTCVQVPIRRSSCGLFSEHGIDSLTKLNGMFAFAVYDVQARKLWLVRDRLGIKPLYYQLNASRLIFASEIKGILALSPTAPTWEISTLHEWLYYGNPLGGRTLYNGIRQLLPGHYLEVDLNSFKHEVRAYWSLKRQAEGALTAPTDEPRALSETRRLLEQAVRRQLVSDVPVGVFLSGGVDSSAITAFASRHYAGRLGDVFGRIRFCTRRRRTAEGEARSCALRHRASRDSYRRRRWSAI